MNATMNAANFLRSGVIGFRRCLGRMLGLMWLTMIGINPLHADDVIFPVLETASGTYSNVTITTRTKDYVFILHSAGMGNIRVQDLSEEAREALGYDVPARKKKPRITLKAPVVMAKELLPEVESKLEESLRQNVPYAKIPGGAGGFVMIAAAVLLALHLGASCLVRMIVLKSKKEPGLLVWIPMFQWIPLLRAAEMSGWWFLLMWVPVVPIFWAFMIAKARGMSMWVSFFLIFPVTSLFAFLYLAFAHEKPGKQGPRYQSMALETA